MQSAGFQRHVKNPYLMVTALRNPLELFVSAQQYLHKKETKTLEDVSGTPSSLFSVLFPPKNKFSK